MKKFYKYYRAFFAVLSVTFILSVNVVSQSEPEPERSIRYITSNKANEATRPRIRVIKRSSISRIPGQTTKNLVADHTGLEKKAFDLINEKRLAKGLDRLRWNDKIAELARQHSENMAKHTFFSHIGLNGRLIDQRAIDFGINNWKAIGENIAYNKGIETPADFAVERWMVSTTHRQNLLDERWTESGIGVGITEDGFYFFTQIFLVH